MNIQLSIRVNPASAALTAALDFSRRDGRTRGITADAKLDVHRSDSRDSGSARASHFICRPGDFGDSTAVLVLHLMEGDGKLARVLCGAAAISRLAAGCESNPGPLFSVTHSPRYRDPDC